MCVCVCVLYDCMCCMRANRVPACAQVRYAAKGGLNYLLVVLGEGVSRQQLEAVEPDFEAMRRGAGAEDVHGVIVCARGGEEEAGGLRRESGREGVAGGGRGCAGGVHCAGWGGGEVGGREVWGWLAGGHGHNVCVRGFGPAVRT